MSLLLMLSNRMLLVLVILLTPSIYLAQTTPIDVCVGDTVRIKDLISSLPPVGIQRVYWQKKSPRTVKKITRGTYESSKYSILKSIGDHSNGVKPISLFFDTGRLNIYISVDTAVSPATAHKPYYSDTFRGFNLIKKYDIANSTLRNEYDDVNVGVGSGFLTFPMSYLAFQPTTDHMFVVRPNQHFIERLVKSPSGKYGPLPISSSVAGSVPTFVAGSSEAIGDRDTHSSTPAGYDASTGGLLNQPMAIQFGADGSAFVSNRQAISGTNEEIIKIGLIPKAITPSSPRPPYEYSDGSNADILIESNAPYPSVVGKPVWYNNFVVNNADGTLPSYRQRIFALIKEGPKYTFFTDDVSRPSQNDPNFTDTINARFPSLGSNFEDNNLSLRLGNSQTQLYIGLRLKNKIVLADYTLDTTYTNPQWALLDFSRSFGINRRILDFLIDKNSDIYALAVHGDRVDPSSGSDLLYQLHKLGFTPVSTDDFFVPDEEATQYVLTVVYTDGTKDSVTFQTTDGYMPTNVTFNASKPPPYCVNGKYDFSVNSRNTSTTDVVTEYQWSLQNTSTGAISDSITTIDGVSSSSDGISEFVIEEYQVFTNSSVKSGSRDRFVTSVALLENFDRVLVKIRSAGTNCMVRDTFDYTHYTRIPNFDISSTDATIIDGNASLCEGQTYDLGVNFSENYPQDYRYQFFSSSESSLLVSLSAPSANARLEISTPQVGRGNNNTLENPIAMYVDPDGKTRNPNPDEDSVFLGITEIRNNANSCVFYDTLAVDILQTPESAINGVMDNARFCLGESIFVAGNGSSGNRQWLINGEVPSLIPPLNVSAPNAQSTDIILNDLNITSISYVASDATNSCFDTSRLSVNVLSQPQVVISGITNNQTFCTGNGIPVTGTLAGGGTPMNNQWLLNGLPNSSVFSPSSTKSSVTIKLNSTDISGLNSTDIKSISYVATNVKGVCFDTLTYMVNVVKTPESAINGVMDNASFCLGESIFVAGNGSNGNRQWLINGEVPSLIPPLNVSAPNAQSTDIILDDLNITSISYVASSDARNTCLDTFTFNIKVVETPTSGIRNISPNQNFCSGETLSIEGTGSLGNRKWLENGSDMTPSISSPTSATTDVQLSPSITSIGFIASDATNTCFDTSFFDFGPNNITFTDISVNLSATPDQYCPFLSSATFTANDVNTIADQYAWLVADDGNRNNLRVVQAASNDNDFVTETAQYVYVIGSSTSKTCKPDTTFRMVSHSSGCITPTLFISSNPEIACHGSAIELLASLSGSALSTDVYQWYLNGNPITGATSKNLPYTLLNSTEDEVVYVFSCELTRTYSDGTMFSFRSSSLRVIGVSNFDYEVYINSTTDFLCPRDVLTFDNSNVSVVAVTSNAILRRPNSRTDITSAVNNFTWNITDAESSAIVSNASTNTLNYTTPGLPVGNYNLQLEASGTFSGCPAFNASSNITSIEVQTNFIPNVELSTTTINACVGSPITINADLNNITDADGTIIWYKNSTLFSATSLPVLITSNISNKDTITAEANTNLVCVTEKVVGSNKLVFNVSKDIQPETVVRLSSDIVCMGSVVVNFVASDLNQPDNSQLSFRWFKNNKLTSNQSNYIELDINLQDSFYCIITNQSGCFDTSAYVFARVDATTDRYTKLGNFPEGNRTASSTLSIGSYGYLLMGRNTQEFYNDLWRYNTANDSWQQLADFPDKGRLYPSTFYIDDNIYVGMGFDQDSIRSNFYSYSITENKWSEWANNFLSVGGTARYGSSTFQIDGLVYLFGGFDFINIRSDMYRLDINGSQWENITSTVVSNSSAGYSGAGDPDARYPSARYHASSFVWRDKAYIGLGESIFSGVPHRDFWEFDPDRLSFTRQPDFAGQRRSRASAFVVNDRPYVGFGFSTNPLKDIWLYNESTPASPWYQREDAPFTARYDMAVFSNSNTAFLGLGNSGNTFNENFWKLESEFLKVIPCIFTNDFKSDSLCLQKDFKITFKYAFPYEPNNEFIAQLSDKQGNFDNPINIGSIVSNVDTTINATIPESVDIDEGKFKIRVVSTNPISDSIFAADNVLKILPTYAPVLTISFQRSVIDSPFCSYELPRVFVSSSNDGGTNPIYLWQLNNDDFINNNSTSYQYGIINQSGASLPRYRAGLINTTEYCLSVDTAFSNTLVPNVVDIRSTIANEAGILSVPFQEEATYDWINCFNGQILLSGSATRTFAPSNVGLYKVNVRVKHCEQESQCVPVEALFSGNFYITRLFPNPSIGDLHIHFNTFFKTLTVNVYSFDGELVMQRIFDKQDNKARINIQALPSGPYILVATNQEKVTANGKFIRR